MSTDLSDDQGKLWFPCDGSVSGLAHVVDHPDFEVVISGALFGKGGLSPLGGDGE